MQTVFVTAALDFRFVYLHPLEDKISLGNKLLTSCTALGVVCASELHLPARLGDSLLILVYVFKHRRKCKLYL